MPRSPPPDRYTPHYSSRDAPRRNYRDEYDRRGPRDEYRRPPLASSYRGRRDYGSPPRGRDRSWDRGERDYPRERERYDDRERERYDDRKRTRSPSPPPPRRRFSPLPPPRERDDRFRRYTSYDRPPSPVSGRGSGLTYAPAETPRNDEERDDAEEVSEEEGMVTPPGVKRKLEDVKPVDQAEPKARLGSPKRRVVDSPPHQINRTPATTIAAPTTTAPPSTTTTEPLSRPDAPFKIALPSAPVAKPKPSPATPAFGARPAEKRDSPPRTSRPPPAPPRQTYASNERDRDRDRGRDRERRGRRYSTSSSFASRSRSPPLRNRRNRSRSRTTTDSRSPRRSRSRSRSTRSPSRTRSPPPATHDPPRGPSSFRRAPPPPPPPARAPPSGPAADPSPAVRNFIPTGPRGRGRGPLVAPRAPRAERMGYAQQPGFRARPVVPPPREAEVPKVDAIRVPEPPAPVEPEREVAPVETVPPTEETKAELLPDREGKVSIQVKPFKRDDPPALPDRTTRVLVSPIAPLSSPATPMEKPAPSPGKIASSPVTDYASTPTREEPGKTETPAKKPNHISLPARPRASSSTVPPTPGVRTPAAPTALRQTTFPRPPAAAAAWGWKEYPPPREVTFKERPTGQDVVLELKAMGVVLPDEGYRGLAERDMTRVAGDWERQLSKMQYERALLTHSFQTIASSLRVKKFELGNALDEVWVAERKIEAAGMTMESAAFSPKRE
ncbi:hypothetical protein NCC49_005279 [Naganishia albida]|nr:hypothetical protein NCC49_005279 [Naganishia albida]